MFYCHFANSFEFVFVGLFFSLPLLFSSLMIWWLILVLCLDSFFFFVCVPIVDFYFAVTMRFWYSSLYIHKIVLSCWSFNFKCISNILHLYSPLSPLLVLISSLGVGDFLPLLYVCLYQWAFPFVVFLFLVVGFSFSPRQVPLAFVVKLVLCWILLAFACL